MPKWTGVCRKRGRDGAPNTVRVTDGDIEHDDISEEDYRRLGIQPPLEDLGWC